MLYGGDNLFNFFLFHLITAGLDPVGIKPTNQNQFIDGHNPTIQDFYSTVPRFSLVPYPILLGAIHGSHRSITQFSSAPYPVLLGPLPGSPRRHTRFSSAPYTVLPGPLPGSPRRHTRFPSAPYLVRRALSRVFLTLARMVLESGPLGFGSDDTFDELNFRDDVSSLAENEIVEIPLILCNLCLPRSILHDYKIHLRCHSPKG